MKKLLLYLLLILPFLIHAQIGIRAGLNFANVTNAASINNSSRTGFHAGIFLDPGKGLLSSRTELIFSRQGYDYKTNTNTGTVNLDYLMLPQYMSINITKLLSIQFGGHIAYLLNAKVDSSSIGTGTGNPSLKILDLLNRFDFGIGGGVEVHPLAGLLIGARMNISLIKLYDPSTYTSGTSYSFIPKTDVKNNLFQLYTGWRFGQ